MSEVSVHIRFCRCSPRVAERHVAKKWPILVHFWPTTPPPPSSCRFLATCRSHVSNPKLPLAFREGGRGRASLRAKQCPRVQKRKEPAHHPSWSSPPSCLDGRGRAQRFRSQVSGPPAFASYGARSTVSSLSPVLGRRERAPEMDRLASRTFPPGSSRENWRPGGASASQSFIF